MIAAPGVTRFVGAVAWKRPERYLKRWRKSSLNAYAVADPRLGFPGRVPGAGYSRVVETGITPLINTGIAHKEGGSGRLAQALCGHRWPALNKAGSTG